MKSSRAFWIIGLIVLTGPEARAAEWRVGVARVDVTPDEPVWMAGYAARKHPAEGTVHPLWAKALAIEDAQGRRAVLVTADVIGFTRRVCDAVAARLEKPSGIKRERIVFSSSHTHCGPVVLGCADIAHHMEPEHVATAAAYRGTLEDKLARLIADALAALQPGKLSFGEGKATFAMNRRTVRGDGYVISPNAKGPVDHGVPVLLACDENDRPLAAVFGYACHNTTLGGDFYRYNGDYAGFAQLALEAKHPGVCAMFVAGCGADSNPQPRGELKHAEEHGKALAAAVDAVLSDELSPVRGPLAVAFERVDLPFVDPPGKEELEARRGQGSVYQQRLTELLLERLSEQGRLDAAYPYPVQVIRFGDDLALVALAGEVVVDYALRLRGEFTDEPIWIAGYANEVFAYVPSERVLAEGGYEGGGAMVYFGWHGPFKPGVEDRVVGLVRKLMTRCREDVR
ncbi:MAG: neutral/alkaline non-lysosomal ceramidase N-terminal domain-containing protein [Planctomycetota bacterium]|jgi:hypothetical protein